VTRIIAGVARGRRLRVPSDGTRPTTDRVRESLFGRLDHLLGGFAGTRVLDLFAGSGALGLEAASRGATAVVLVERDRRAAAVARANARSVGVSGVEVVGASVDAYLAAAPTPFDLILADPPYAVTSPQVQALLGRLAEGWLAPDAIVVVERPTRGSELTWPEGLVALRHVAYGETTLWYGQRAPEGEDP
jgi:16S rRNA (guanine966-N2)-methyltransferase